jgi:hypothetical protein
MGNIFETKAGVSNKFKAIATLIAVLVIFAAAVYVYNKDRAKEVEVTFISTLASASDPVLTLAASSNTVQVDQIFTVNVDINTQGRSVSAAEIHLDFPSGTFQAISLVKGTFLPVELSAGSVSSGMVAIILGCDPSAPKAGSGTLAVLTLKALAPSSAQIQYSSNTKIAVIGESNSVIGSMSPVTITVANIPLPSATFTANPNKITRGYESATLTWASENAQTINIDNGIGGVGLSGSRSVNPSTSTTYTLTASSGANSTTKQVTISVYKPGDLDKNGLVNIYDYNTIISDFGKSGSCPADINKDNVVNIFDYNLLVSNFGS